jgi:phosphoglycolate phosphatase-like HAD superfamily hydrolase
MYATFTTLLLTLLPPRVLSFTLITFDVDGTLVKGSGRAAAESAHARAFSHAVSEILGDGTPVTPVAEALPRHLYHGSTDGLILLRLARATLGVEPEEAYKNLDRMFDCMYDYISAMENEEIADHITPLPGVKDKLEILATMTDQALCGLVTGNVEGIARKKMDAVGILATKALSPPSDVQKPWAGSEDIGFLGGFGSDYCSGNIDDPDRNHIDRGEQIAIAAERGKLVLGTKQLKRIVHVGDAPADVLAAKWYSQTKKDDDLCVGLVAVATGSYSSENLRELAGEPIPGTWEPIVLEDGMADPGFLKACGLE